MRGRKILYSCGSLAAAVSNQAFLTYITFFYIDVMKFPKTLFGLAWFFFGLWNAINDPLFGQWSDRTRTRWGRRIPFIALGTVPFALFFFLLWVPPSTAAQQGWLFWYLLGSMFLFDSFFTLVVLNWTALFPEMFPSLEERAEVSAWRQILAIVGLVLGMAIPPILYKGLGWAWMGGALALVTLATMFLSLLGSRERPEYRQGAEVGLIRALKFTFTSKAFLLFALANFGITLAMGTVQATFAFFAKYILHAEGMIQTLLLGTAFLVTLPLLLFWRAVTVKRGPRAAQICTAAAFGLACLGFIFVGSVPAAFVLCGLLGVGLAGLMLIPDLLISDVIDEDELRTGERREGMFFGINGLAIRLAGALQGVIIASVLTVFRYDENAAAQTATALFGIRFLMSAIPLAALVLTVLGMIWYPLHGRRLEEIKARVGEKHAAL
ncbi:MAG: MFS transporter [Patescibacteria group bacterium]